MSNSYDEADELVLSVKGTGSSAEYDAMTYDGDGNLLTQTDYQVSSGTTLSASYLSDSYNNVGQLVLSVKGTGTYAESDTMTYDGDGNLLTQTDYQVSSGTTLTASYLSDSYNNVGDLVLSVRGSGNSADYEAFTYDADNNEVTSTDYQVSAGTTLTASYVSNSYNLASQLVVSVDGASNSTSYGYDADGDKTLEISGYGTTDSASTQYFYDEADNMVKVIDANANTTSIAYNADGNSTAMTQVLGTDTSTASYSYNTADQLTKTIDEDGQTESEVLDADGELLTDTWYNSGGTSIAVASYTYDEAGDMLTAVNTQGTDTFSYSFSYNGDGNVLTASEPFGVSLSFGYDLAGNRNSVSDSFGGSETLTDDADGNLTTLSYTSTGQSLSINFTYNKADQETGETMYSSGTLIATVSESLNGDGQALNILDTNHGGSTIDSFNYSYNYAASVTSESDYSGTSTSYSYYHNGELKSANLITYDFNAGGDASNTGDSSTNGNEETAFVDPVSGDTLSMTYDDAGNMSTKTDSTAGTEWTYGYNNANQMVSAVTKTSGGSPTTLESVTYEYDAFGNLMKESVTPYSGGSPGTTTTTEFAVDGWNPATGGFNTWAIMNSSGSLQTRNIYGNGLDQYLARSDNNTNGASDATGIYWLLTDKQGSVRYVLDNTANDPAVNKVEYNAFGQILSQTNSNDLGRYGFDSYDHDAATLLDLVNARVYDPELQQWTSQDPDGFTAGDSNLRRYVDNSPVNGVDPSGMRVHSSSHDADVRLVEWGIRKQVTAVSRSTLQGAINQTRWELRSDRLDNESDRRQINTLKRWITSTMDPRYINDYKSQIAYYQRRITERGRDIKNNRLILNRLLEAGKSLQMRGLEPDVQPPEELIEITPVLGPSPGPGIPPGTPPLKPDLPKIRGPVPRPGPHMPTSPTQPITPMLPVEPRKR